MSNAASSYETDQDGASAQVGDDIRAFRKTRSMTIAELALALGRSVGWLSQIERGQTEPAIADLKKISRIFGIPVSFFFRNEAAPERERGHIVRAASRAVLGSNEDGITEELLSPDLAGDFEMIRSIFAPGALSETIPARAAQDGGYVVSGRFNLWVGEKLFELKAGDSFGFKNQDYRWQNPGDEQAVVIWVISPPIY
ncbi:MAG: helix-turn-helix domain-containing protein [Rhizobiaceae bacterium]